MMTVKGMTSEEVKTLKLYLRRHPHFSFEVSGFWIPKFIEKSDSVRSYRKTWDIYKHRLELLKKRGPGEKAFIRYYESQRKTFPENLSGKYIEQFPVFITNRKKWQETCMRTGCTIGMVDRNGRKYWERNYFALDLYLPYPKIAIELDYESTHPCPEYDAARDLYLKEKYGIKTIRYRNYNSPGHEDETLAANADVVALLGELEKEKDLKIDYFDYTAYSVQSFNLMYYIELDVLEGIRKIEGYEKKEFHLTDKELGRYYKMTKHQKISQSVERLKWIMEIIGLEL